MFAEGLLVGVVDSDPSAWGHRRLNLIPVRGFAWIGRLLHESGVEVRARALTTPGQGAALSFEDRLLAYTAARADRVRVVGLPVSARVLVRRLVERGKREPRDADRFVRLAARCLEEASDAPADLWNLVGAPKP